MPIDDQLKKAIIQMPPREKDKLLLRLVAKDSTLTDKLYFELIEESSTLHERRDLIRSRIVRLSKAGKDTPGWILMDMRDLSGDITYHVKVTKDKIGGLELNIFLLNTFMETYEHKLVNFNSRTDKIALYIVKKAQTVLNQLAKLDEDYRFDFLKDANRMLASIYQQSAKIYARQLALPAEIE